MRPVYHIFSLYALIAIMMVLSCQRHAKLQKTTETLQHFQKESKNSRDSIKHALDETRTELNRARLKNGLAPLPAINWPAVPDHDITGR